MSALKYVNILGESSWEDKSKHVEKLTKKDIEIIKKSSEKELRKSEDILKNLKGDGYKNLDFHGKEAWDQMKLDIKFYQQLMSKIDRKDGIRNINEEEWNIIRVRLSLDDNQEWIKEHPYAIKMGVTLESDKYYEDLRNTTAKVELISGRKALKIK